jgi:hypothetical protein
LTVTEITHKRVTIYSNRDHTRESEHKLHTVHDSCREHFKNSAEILAVTRITQDKMNIFKTGRVL